MTPPPDPLTPDEIEQRQHPDGTVEPDVPARPTDDTGAPLTPDEIEQQMPVGGDEEAEQPIPDDDEELG